MWAVIRQHRLTEEEAGLLAAEALVVGGPRAELAAVVTPLALAILVLVLARRALLEPDAVTAGVPPRTPGTAEAGGRPVVRAGQAGLVTVWGMRTTRSDEIRQCHVCLFVYIFLNKVIYFVP